MPTEQATPRVCGKKKRRFFTTSGESYGCVKKYFKTKKGSSEKWN